MNVCMVAYTFYEMDGRVRRYAETLVKKGDKVDVISLNRSGQQKHAILNGVAVYKIMERKVDEKKKIDYLKRTVKFLIKSFWFITIHHLKKKYQLVHVHSVPDFEVFAALVPKITGAKIILDIHDIVPEFYRSKFNSSDNSLLFKALLIVEKLSIAFSNHVIISNHIWKERLLRRSAKKNKCSVILNYPDQSLFRPKEKRKSDGKFIMLYPGTFMRHQGLDIAIKAMARIKNVAPNIYFYLYGYGPEKNELIKTAKSLNVEDRVIIRNTVGLEALPMIIAEANAGIVPKRNDGFSGEAFSTKILEFMSMGIPTIVSRTKIDRYYFNDSLVLFFNPEDDQDLAKAIIKIATDKELRKKLADNSKKFVKKYNWDINKYVYINLVKTLVGRTLN